MNSLHDIAFQDLVILCNLLVSSISPYQYNYNPTEKKGFNPIQDQLIFLSCVRHTVEMRC